MLEVGVVDEFVFSLLYMLFGWLGVLCCIVGWRVDLLVIVGVVFCGISASIVGGNWGIVGFFVRVL